MAISVSKKIQDLIDGGLFHRLPATFCTYFLNQIQDWNLLFPAEQNYYERLFTMLNTSDQKAVDALFAPLLEAERQMGVTPANFPRDQFTLVQVEFINRSKFYTQWRQAVVFAFSRIDPILDTMVSKQGRPRLVVIVSPRDLPAGADRMWARISKHGRRVKLVLPPAEGDYVPLLLTGAPREQGASTFADLQAAAPNAERYDSWVIDAGETLCALSKHPNVARFSYANLQTYRLRLMEDVQNLIEKEHIRGSTALGPRLKELKVMPTESELSRDAVLSEFLRSTLLVGNGTLLLHNTFVEWSTVNAVRRARPVVTISSFRLRNQLKPFSSLLIYNDQDAASAAPAPPDFEGSHADLEIFYQYVWQEYGKYAEYRGNTSYLFVREGLDELLAIAPADFPLLNEREALPLEYAFLKTKTWLGV